MSRRDDFFSVLAGEKPERIPFISFAFWNQATMERLAPRNCCDENMLPLLSDNPPMDRFSPEPRSDTSREKAVNMGNFLDVSTMGVGKGGLLSFGHGGPGDIQPHVINRNEQFKTLLYEGGHKRQVNFDPFSVHYYNFPVKDESDLERLELPDMRNPERFQDIEADTQYFKAADFVPSGAIQGFFSGIHNSFMDFQDTMLNFYDKPELMKALIAKLAQMSLDAVEMYLERGVEVIEVCDDLGTNDSLLISPQLIREFIIPWYEELVSITHEWGGYVHFHSHGNIEPIMDDLVSTGFDIINPFDWKENPNLIDLIKRYSDRVIFCGGLDGNMSLYTLDEVKAIVNRATSLADLTKRGYILLGGSANENVSKETYMEWRDIYTQARLVSST